MNYYCVTRRKQSHFKKHGVARRHRFIDESMRFATTEGINSFMVVFLDISTAITQLLSW